MKACRTVPVILTSLLAGTACATGPALENQRDITGPPGDSKHLTIGSAGFTESDLLARMYALLLDRAGYSTEVISVTEREIYEPALETGRIDVVPEYAATFADWLNTKKNGADATPVGSPDRDTTIKALRALVAPAASPSWTRDAPSPSTRSPSRPRTRRGTD